MSTRVLQGRFSSDKQLLHSLAEQTGLYDDVLYTSLTSNDEQVKYLELVASTSQVENHNFKKYMYENLEDPQDRLSYLSYGFYGDKDEKTDDYFKYKFTEKLEKDIYNNTSKMKRFLTSTGIMIGNALNETVLGSLEGLIDLSMLMFGASNEEIAADAIGVGAIREKLAESARKYSNLDKNSVWQFADNVLTGAARLSVAAIGPGKVGQFLYFASMAGNTAGQTAADIPDINRWRLIGYTAANTSMEVLTEHLFANQFFSGMFKPANTGRMLKDSFRTALGEFAEESLQEFMEPVLYYYLAQDNEHRANNKLEHATLQEIMYAGLVGFAVAFITTPAMIAVKTPKSTLSIVPNQVDTSGKITTVMPIEISGKRNVYKHQMDVSKVLDTLKEYRSNPEATPQKVIDSVMILNKVYEQLGDDGFAKVVNMANVAIEHKVEEIARFFEFKKSNQAIEGLNEFETKFPNNTINAVKNISPEFKQYAKNIEQQVGKRVQYVEFANGVGMKEINGAVSTNNYIFIDPSAVNRLGKDNIIKSLIYSETEVLTQNWLGEVKLNEMIDLIKDMNPTLVENLKDIPKHLQQEALINDFLTDMYSADILFKYDKEAFSKIKNLFSKRLKNLKKDSIKYSVHVEIINKLNDIVFKNVDNYSQALKWVVKNDLMLTEDEFNELKKGKDAQSVFVPVDMSKGWIIVENITKDLSNNSNTPVKGEFNFENALNKHIYKPEFVEKIEQQYNKPFEDAMNYYLHDTHGVIFSPVIRMFLKPVDIKTSGLFDVQAIERAMRRYSEGSVLQYLTPLGKKVFKNLNDITLNNNLGDADGVYDFVYKLIDIEIKQSAAFMWKTLSHELTHHLTYELFDGRGVSFPWVDSIGKAAVRREIDKIFAKNKKLQTFTSQQRLVIVNNAPYYLDFVELIAGQPTSASTRSASKTGVRYTFINGKLHAIGTGLLYGLDVDISKYVRPGLKPKMSKINTQTQTKYSLSEVGNSLANRDGATIKIENGEVTELSFNSGYQVAYRENSHTVKKGDAVGLQQAIEKMHAANPDLTIGTRVNNEGNIDVDYSVNIDSLEAAMKLAAEQNQDSIWDWANGEGIKVVDYFNKQQQQQQQQQQQVNSPTNTALETFELLKSKRHLSVGNVQNISPEQQLVYHTNNSEILKADPRIQQLLNNETDLVQVLNDLYNPDLKLDDYQRNTRNALMVLAKINVDIGMYTDATNKLVDDLFAAHATNAGISLYLVSQIHAKLSPGTHAINDFEKKFKVKANKEVKVAGDAFTKAMDAKNYEARLQASKNLVKAMIKQARESRPSFREMFSTNKDTRLHAFRRLSETILSFRYLAMLSSPATHARNLTSNYMQKGINKLDGASQGVFEKMFNRKIDKNISMYETQLTDLNNQLKNITDQNSEQYKITQTEIIRVENLLKLEQNQIKFKGGEINDDVKSYVNKHFVENKLIEYIVYNTHGKYDTTGRKGIYTKVAQGTQFALVPTQWASNVIMSSLEGLDVKFVQSQTQIFLEQIIQANHGADVSNITEAQQQQYMQLALDQSLELYFRNDNAFNNWWFGMTQKHPLIAMFMGTVMPFPRVASNMLSQIYKHSPAYFVQTIIQQARGNVNQSNTFYAQLAKQYGQAVTGTVLMTLGVLLKALGWIDLDKDEKNGMVLSIGDVRFTLDNLAPSITPMLLGAYLLSNEQEVNILAGLYDQTMLGNINSLFQYNYSLEQALIVNPLETYALQYVPAIFKTVARATDPYVKDTTGQLKFMKRLGASLPGISHFVPNRKDPYTGVDLVRSVNWFEFLDPIALLNTVSPVRILYDSPNYYKARAEELDTTIGFVSNSYTINGEKIKLNTKQKSRYGEIRGKVIEDKLKTLFNTTGLSPEEQASGVRSAQSQATQIAKIDYWIKQGNTFVFSDFKEAAYARKILGTTTGIVVRKNHKGTRFVSK